MSIETSAKLLISFQPWPTILLKVIVVRITADQKKKISFSATLRAVRNQDHSNYATDYFHMSASGNNILVLTGKSADYLAIKGQLRYEARMKAVCEDGTTEIDRDYLEIKDASSVTLTGNHVTETNFLYSINNSKFNKGAI
ncbi:MAG TPA: glycoside hydrolase N-terminal domain-containing protein [Hanamia sp.]|nr:glycoside hydrolase N-terminal domain-containing protein [Hanamia sp.]